MKLRILAVSLAFLASPAFAADIDGQWSGSITTPGGAMQVSYTFKADGGALTGTTQAPDGSATPIKDGKIDGNKLTFAVTLDFGAGATTLNYTGELSGKQLMLHTSFMDMPIDITLTRT